MTINSPARTEVVSVANFPEHYFLENLAVRADGSILVTALNHGEVWLVPAPNGSRAVEPILVDTLDGLAMGVVETDPDVFYVCTPAQRTRVLNFDPPGAGLNGCCLLAPDVIAIADCVAGLIWRVDLAADGRTAAARPWLKHDTMAASYTDPFAPVKLTPTVEIPMPGVNGVRYASRTNYLYYTGSAEQIFMRVPVDPSTHDPAGEPELVTKGIHAVDDFCIDEDAGVAYITTHIDNTIHRVPLDPATGPAPTIVAGQPFTDPLVGPSSIVWARGPKDYGRTAYVSTDGGYAKLPPDGAGRTARVVRVDFAPLD